MLKKFLFETAIGNWLLALFERTTGLAIVDAAWLGGQSAAVAAVANDVPAVIVEPQPSLARWA
jgi:hypothetical protein